MKLLLHTCCAPCSVQCVEALRAEDIRPDLFWYNPNIHPYTEYKARRDTLVQFTTDEGLDLHMEDDYGLRTFIAGVYPHFENRSDGEIPGEGPPDVTGSPRCAVCYRLRLDKTAAYAAAHGYDCFSTTLLISPYQKHDLIREVAEGMAGKYGVQFFYRDFRPGFREGQKQARERGFYMQKYCGCIFSEEERYLGKRE
ncbi:epoxyqueuosine reductase QueH [Treponema primitia]|uniref:epoxyqueuosine reductase QueH n=1 Tax=Treponema primitia TaxID=88058 RepID=UPI0002554C32|nr:epoxyqueuosine reductase QueH [Treponema primitia]